VSMGSYRSHHSRDRYRGDRGGDWANSLRKGDRKREAHGRRSSSRRYGRRDRHSSRGGGHRGSDRHSRSRHDRKPPQRGKDHHRRDAHDRRGRSHDRDRSRAGKRRRSKSSPVPSEDEEEYSSSSESRSTNDKSSDSQDDDKAKKKKKNKSAGSNKDEIIHFAWRKNDILNSRYKLIKLLGDGTFGRVLLAHDQNTDQQVAVKVIRDVKRYGENAKIEADILKDIRKVDPRGEASRSAVMYDTFDHGRHFCLVFEPCGASLYDFLKRNSFRGFWLQDIQSFASDSMTALAFLHDKLKMTHTDLKPENILLESLEPPRQAEFPREASWKPSGRRSAASPYLRPVTPALRLIDFGNATYADDHHSSIINTRQYRSPEVIMANGWNERSDVWSMGCIFMELYAGELLFGTHENLEHLALMERILEPLPATMLAAAPRESREKYVQSGSRPRLKWPEGAQNPSSERHVRSQKPLADMATHKGHRSFTDFVGHLLTLDPAKRPSASEALKHDFLLERFSD